MFRNTAAQSAATVMGYAFSFLLAPLLLARLGLAEFGVWAVTGAMATYAGLADLGIAQALARFIARYDARGDERAVRECVGLGLIAATFVGIVAFGLAIALTPLASQELGVLDTDDMRVVLLSSAGILVASMYRTVFNAVGIGLRQMVAPSVASGVNHTLNFVASVAVLLISPTLVDYALANVAASFGGVAATMVGLRYVWRGWPVALPSRALTREVLGYSLKNQVSWAADLVNFQTDKIVIAVMIDVKAAGAYEIGARVVLAAHAVSILTLAALIPTAAAAIETQGRAMIAGFYRHYTRLTVGISFPIQVLCCVAAPFILVAWLGEAPSNSAAVLIVLSAAYLFKSITGVASSVALADGRAGLVASNQVLMAGLNIVFTVSLAPLFGLWGVLAGTFAALTTGALLFMYRFHKVYEMPFSDFTEGVRGPLLLSVGLAVPFGIVDWIVSRSVDARPGAAVALIAVSAIYGLLYWIAASRLGYLPERLMLGRARRREREAVATTT